MTEPTLQAAKPPPIRMISLDGLRGIAAIVILMFHFEVSHGTRGLFTSGYLAVDFFFMLSGLVLVGPIENRAGKEHQSGLAIFIARCLRFWPLMTLGAVLGAAVQFLVYPAGQVLPLFVLASLSIPLAWKAGDAFALNGPQWSLFVELVCNAVHVVLLRKLSVSALLAISCAFGVFLAVGADLLTTEALGREYDEIIVGFVRAGFAYPLGIIIGRKQNLMHGLPTFAGWIAPTMLIAAIVFPTAIGIPKAYSDPFARAAFVLVLIVGIRSRLSENAARRMAWLGAISFPLYAIHAPIINLADIAGRAASDQLRPLIYLAGPAVALALGHLLARSGIASGIRLPITKRPATRPAEIAVHNG